MNYLFEILEPKTFLHEKSRPESRPFQFHIPYLPAPLLRISQHNLQGIVPEEGVGVVQEQHVRNLFRLNQILQILKVVPRIHHHDFPVVLRQERNKTICVGILNQQQAFPTGHRRFDGIHRMVASTEHRIGILLLQILPTILLQVQTTTLQTTRLTILQLTATTAVRLKR